MKIAKKILLIIVLLSSLSGFSQISKTKNQAKYDYKKLHFGFSLGMNFMNFSIQPIKNMNSIPLIRTVESVAKPGFNLGIVSDLRLNRHFNLRFIPALAYTQRDIHFGMIDESTQENYTIVKQVESTFIELPFSVKYRSTRVTNGRAYLLAGIKYNIDMVSQAKVEDKNLFKVKKHDFLYELGFGVDVYFEFFKFSLEIKASFGLNNILVNDDTQFTDIIDKIYTKAFLLSFTFE